MVNYGGGWSVISQWTGDDCGCVVVGLMRVDRGMISRWDQWSVRDNWRVMVGYGRLLDVFDGVCDGWCGGIVRDNRLMRDVLGGSWGGDDRCRKVFRWGCGNEFCRGWGEDFSDGYCTCRLRDDGVEAIDSVGGLINGAFKEVSIIKTVESLKRLT